jgi:hypothetical protein
MYTCGFMYPATDPVVCIFLEQPKQSGHSSSWGGEEASERGCVRFGATGAGRSHFSLASVPHVLAGMDRADSQRGQVRRLESCDNAEARKCAVKR